MFSVAKGEKINMSLEKANVVWNTIKLDWPIDNFH